MHRIKHDEVRRMPGWNLSSGELQYKTINEDMLWSKFNYVFSDASKKRNTYKFGFLKSILDNLLNATFVNDELVIYYHDIFAKFTENYWNLTLKYHLKQMVPDGKSTYSRVEQILNQSKIEWHIPDGVPFDSLEVSLKELIISKVQKDCKRYVIGALYEDLEGIVYGFDLKKDYLVIHPVAYQFMLKYKMELEKLNYYAWAKFLEKVNDDDVLVRLLDKLELALPQRKNLDVYRNILHQEFEQQHCFYCGKKLKAGSHVDHFIPWSFVKEDRLWNFVLSCPTCNTKKNDKLPEYSLVAKLQTRNKQVELVSEFSKQQFANYNAKIIDDLWQYAYYAGFKEYKVK